MPTLLGQIGDRARNPKCNKTAAFSCGANVRDEGEPRLVRVYTKLGDREHIFCHDTSSFDLVSPAHVRSRPNSTNHPRGICKHKQATRLGLRPTRSPCSQVNLFILIWTTCTSSSSFHAFLFHSFLGPFGTGASMVFWWSSSVSVISESPSP